MFVSLGRYNQLRRKNQMLELELMSSRMKALNIQVELNKMTKKWNNLVERINRLGGEEFLTKAKIQATVSPQFTQDELRMLIYLCHPDKHAGSKSACAITTKLLGMRR